MDNNKENSKLTIKEGYKQTEIGIIPEDWEFKEIGDEIDLLTGFPFPSSHYSSDGVRLLRGSNIKRGITDWSDDLIQYWKQITPELRKYVCEEGDIVIAMDGSLVGKSYARLTKKDLPALLLQRVARIRSKKIDLGFLNEYIGNEYFSKHCDSVKTVTAIPHISPSDIRKFQIPIPPIIEEQQAIAEVLSDVDALITSLDQLIAKKRNIKQGAMQLLLTGKKRLPGFSGDWGTKKLGEIAEIDVDNLKSNTNPNYTFQYVSLEDVDIGILRNSTECIFRFAPSRARRKIQKNDVLVSTVRPNLKSHLHIENDLKDFICSTGFSVIRCDEETSHAGYIYNHFFGNVIDRQINLLLVGSNYPSINSKDIKNLQIPLPPIEEQKAIAQILSDMDAEIEALGKKRDKYKALKQGMMQELLTGKTRLRTKAV